MDDDLQNPPDQALLLIDEAMDGWDVVFGRFERKKAAGYRKLGSKLISMINRRVFAQPPGLAVSNFRILRRDVVDRICDSRTAHPYITGQALLYSNNRTDVLVRHDPREVGTSNYGLTRILRLVFAILFSYSLFPLRAAAAAGFVIAAVSFLLGALLPRTVVLRRHPGRRLDDHRGAALACSTGSPSRCSRCSASTSSAPSTPSAPRTPTTSCERVSG